MIWAFAVCFIYEDLPVNVVNPVRYNGVEYIIWHAWHLIMFRKHKHIADIPGYISFIIERRYNTVQYFKVLHK